MKEDLFQPSLGGDYIPTKSFNLTYIYLIAFFGGVIPLIGICGTNAKWLRVDKKKIDRLAALCIVILAIKILLIAMFAEGALGITQGAVNIFYRIACLAAASLYSRAMKEPYAQHQLAGRPMQPMRNYLIPYIMLGIAVESILIFPVLGFTMLK